MSIDRSGQNQELQIDSAVFAFLVILTRIKHAAPTRDSRDLFFLIFSDCLTLSTWHQECTGTRTLIICHQQYANLKTDGRKSATRISTIFAHRGMTENQRRKSSKILSTGTLPKCSLGTPNRQVIPSISARDIWVAAVALVRRTKNQCPAALVPWFGGKAAFGRSIRATRSPTHSPSLPVAAQLDGNPLTTRTLYTLPEEPSG